MKHRARLLVVSLSLLPAAGCKKDPRDVIHTEEIGSTGFVIELPKETRTSRYGDKADLHWEIKNGTHPEGYVIQRTISDQDRIPDEEWATSYCHGSNTVFKTTADGGASISCFKNENGTNKYVGKAWIPDGKGSFFDCEYVALGGDAKDAAALKLSRRVCASIRKK